MSRYQFTHLGDTVPILCKAFIVVVTKENMEKVIERFLEWEGGVVYVDGWGLDKERILRRSFLNLWEQSVTLTLETGLGGVRNELRV
jgi:hypothetical protein